MSNHDATRFIEILRQLPTTQFRDLAGTRITADVPVSERLLNELIAAAIPPDAPVRNVTIRPEGGDRVSVRIVPKMSLIPAITLRLVIEGQPRVPDAAVLVLRMATLSGFFGLASGAISGMLPPGVRLDGERILVDLREIARQRGFAAAFEYLMDLQVHADEGRLVVHLDAGVGSR
jgi:hypothetical protein